MNKKNFTLIIILLVTSLVSILFVQFNWISDLNRLNEDRFKQDVQHVLYMINERLEEKEIINLTKDNLEATLKIRRSNDRGGVELIESTFNKETVDSTKFISSKNSFQFDIESGDRDDSDINSNINASIQIEDMDDLTLDTAIQNNEKELKTYKNSQKIIVK